MVSEDALKIIAPAKVNLTLHVTGRRDDGYHLLHSLVAFTTNFGDEITITPCNEFKFTQNSNNKNLPENTDENLIVKTAKKLAKHFKKDLPYHIHLNKKIPIGAGLGGGSSDAAHIAKALCHLWEVLQNKIDLDEILLSLGADIPVCYHGKICMMEGIGETTTDVNFKSPLYALLVYPNQVTSTPDIFKKFNQDFSVPFINTDHVWHMIKNGQNDLTQSAIENTPIIKDVLDSLQNIEGCQIARMSGSGSCCFGLFNNAQESINATKTIKDMRPDWWAQPVILQ